MIEKILKSTVVSLSLVTLVGIFLHDTRIDKLAIASISLPASGVLLTAAALRSDPHTHSEGGSLQKTSRSFSIGTQIHPREVGRRKHMMQKRSTRSSQPFGGCYQPLMPLA